MTDAQTRYGKAFAVALAVHIIACLGISALGYSLNKTPPQILEVTLAGGGAPPKKGSDKPVQANKPAVKPAPEAKKDDIVEKKNTTPTQSTVQEAPQTEATNAAQGDPNGHENGVEGGKGTDPNSKGTGSGSGEGTGSGSGVGTPAVPPRISYSYKPPYPSSARNSGKEGTVYVKVLVNTSGKVEEAYVSSSSGNSILDEAAVNALYKWRFTPAKDGVGKPTSCYITIPISFNLKN